MSDETKKADPKVLDALLKENEERAKTEKKKQDAEKKKQDELKKLFKKHEKSLEIISNTPDALEIGLKKSGNPKVVRVLAPCYNAIMEIVQEIKRNDDVLKRSDGFRKPIVIHLQGVKAQTGSKNKLKRLLAMRGLAGDLDYIG